MKLTPGILKSVESSFHQSYNIPIQLFVCKYRGRLMYEDKKTIFTSKKKAVAFVNKFVFLIFWQGEYWQQYKDNIKKRTGYDVDYSATIAILPQYGPTARLDLPENKKMIKDIAKNLIKEDIITIEPIVL